MNASRTSPPGSGTSVRRPEPVKSILIVDDHAMIREPIEAVLRDEGYATRTACDGREALLALAESTPDLVLLDLSMPVMSGLQVLEQMRKEHRLRHIPVMVLSAAGEKTKVVRAATLGVSGYVLKSCLSLDDLLQRVKDHFSTEGSGTKRGLPAESSAPAPAPSKRRDGSPLSIVAGSEAPLNRTAGANESAAVPNPLEGLVPLMARHELLRRLGACSDFKGLSPAVAHVLTLTANPRCSTDAVAKAIGQDHAIALKILKLANSSVYTRRAQVESVQKAVVRIGIERIRQTVLNVSVVERFSAVAFDEHLCSRQFWEHAIACGVIAAEIAAATREMDPDTAFTIGLLHDVGRIVMAEQLGDDYVKVISAARRVGRPLEEVEAWMLGADHAEVTGHILQGWHFPKDLAQPIVHHHDPLTTGRAESQYGVEQAAILALADRLAHALMLGSSGNDVIYPTGQLCATLEIGAGVIARLQTVATAQTDDIKIAMLSQSSGVPWPRRADQLRAALKHPFRPLFIGAAPATDAFRIFCAALAAPAASGPPAVAVVHLESATDRHELGDRLRSAEKELMVPGLPVLLLSSAGGLTPNEISGEGRRCVWLPTPTPIDVFVAAINQLGESGRAAA